MTGGEGWRMVPVKPTREMLKAVLVETGQWVEP